MVLVDYSSGSDSDSDSPAPAKRRKTSASSASASAPAPKQNQPPLPPLPAAFHDLYASTVRVSIVDDPSLHQGRKRVNPHKVGNWPSHLYVDVRPTDADRLLLEDLVAQITARLAAATNADRPQDGDVTSRSHDGAGAASPTVTPSAEAVPIHTFLSSDLGAPQPLHISLSRPLSLQTAQKESFLKKAREGVAASGLQGPFGLRVLGVYWHRTRESERSFLVLKIASADHAPCSRLSVSVTTPGDADNPGQQSRSKPATTTTTNPELQALLARFNGLAAEFGQPQLYAITPKSNMGVGNADEGHDVQAAPTTRDAFHVSVAWSPAVPTPRIRSVTAEVAEKYFPSEPRSDPRDDGPGQEGRGPEVNAMTFHVDAIKLKIGNAVTSLPL